MAERGVGGTDRAARTARATRSGPGRLLIAVYAVFALSATARSVVQMATKFSVAPVAISLSAFAALVYVLATYCLARADPASRRIARLSLLLELAGVLVVGTLSLTEAFLFPEPTVWSDFGRGYGYVPLVLPLWGLWWLRRTARTR